MNKEKILNTFLLANIPEIITQEEFDDVKKAIKELQQENKQLKDNWNKLKEFIEKDYDFYDKLIAPEYGCAMGALRRIKDEMQELEQGSD